MFEARSARAPVAALSNWLMDRSTRGSECDRMNELTQRAHPSICRKYRNAKKDIEREIIVEAPVCVTGGVVMLWCAICKFGCGCDVFAATAQRQSGVDWLFCVAVLKCWVRQSHRIWCPGVCVCVCVWI